MIQVSSRYLCPTPQLRFKPDSMWILGAFSCLLALVVSEPAISAVKKQLPMQEEKKLVTYGGHMH